MSEQVPYTGDNYFPHIWENQHRIDYPPEDNRITGGRYVYQRHGEGTLFQVAKTTLSATDNINANTGRGFRLLERIARRVGIDPGAYKNPGFVFE